MSFVLNFKNWSKVNEEAMDATAANNGTKAFNAIRAAMSGIGTDEPGVEKGVMMILTLEDYKTCLALVKAASTMFDTYETIMEYIATDMSYGDEYDEDQAAPVQNWGQLDNNPYLNRMSAHLRKFSGKEVIWK
jgi:hypothetical protein